MSVLGTSSLALPRQRSRRQPPSVDLARHTVVDNDESTVSKDDAHGSALAAWQPFKGGFDDAWADDGEADTDSTATSPCSLHGSYDAIAKSANTSPSPRRRKQENSHAFVFASPKLVRKKSTPSLPSQCSEPQVPETDLQRPSTSSGGSRARSGQGRAGRSHPGHSGANGGSGKASHPQLARVLHHHHHGDRTTSRSSPYSSCSSAESDTGGRSRTASPAYFHQPYISSRTVGPSRPAQALMPSARPATPTHHHQNHHHHMGAFPPVAGAVPMGPFHAQGHPQYQVGHGLAQAHRPHPQQHLYAQHAGALQPAVLPQQLLPQPMVAPHIAQHHPMHARYAAYAAPHGLAAAPPYGVGARPVTPPASVGSNVGSDNKPASHASTTSAPSTAAGGDKAKKQGKKSNRRRRKSKAKGSQAQPSEKSAAAGLSAPSNGMYQSTLSLDEINIALPGWMCTDVCGIKKKKTRRGCRGHRRNRKKKQQEAQNEEEPQEQQAQQRAEEAQEHKDQAEEAPQSELHQQPQQELQAQKQHEQQPEHQHQQQQQEQQVLHQFLQEVEHAAHVLQEQQEMQEVQVQPQEQQEQWEAAGGKGDVLEDGKQAQAPSQEEQQPPQETQPSGSCGGPEPTCDPWTDWFSDEVALARAAIIPTKRAESIQKFRTLSTSDPNVTQQKLDELCDNITYLPHELGLKP